MKKGAIIGLICGAAAVGLAAIGVSVTVILNSPVVRVEKGIAKFLTDIGASGEQFNEGMGLSKIRSESNGQNYQSTYEVDIYDMEGLEDLSLGVDGTIQCDYDNEKLKEEFSLSLAYYEFVSCQMTVDKTDVYLEIPVLYDGSIVFDSQNIDEQFNNSIFKEAAEMEMDEELSLDFFEKPTNSSGNFYKEYKKSIDQMIKNADISKYEGTLNIEIAGKDTKCKGYLVTFKKRDVNKVLESLYGESDSDEVTYALEKDLKLLIYMDNKNNIRQIQTEDDICMEDLGGSMSVALRFTGKDNIFDVMKGKMGFTIDGETATVNFDYTSGMEDKEIKQKLQMKASTDDTDLIGMDYEAVWNTEDSSFEMDMVFDIEDENFVLDMNGNVETNSSADSYSINFTDCAVSYEDEQIATFDATYCREPLKEDISLPKGKTYPIFEMTETEFGTFLLECEEKLGQYSDMLEGMGDLF